MNRLLARVAVAALAVPLALGAVSGTAHADHLCFGATSTGFVCDPGVQSTAPVGVTEYIHEETVCAGTCVSYMGSMYRVEETGDDLHVCVTYEDRAGNESAICPV